MDIKQIQVKGTIVSFYPFRIEGEHKPGLVPEFFDIEAGDPKTGTYGITYIDSVYRRQYLGEEQGGWTEIPVMASELCESLVNDFIRSNIATSANAYPGLMWLPDNLTTAIIAVKHKDKVAELKAIQDRWFKNLVETADDMWSKTRQHRAITFIQKYAAQYLNLDREWLTDTEIQNALSKCPICQENVLPVAIICSNCKYILKPKEYEAVKGQFAGV